ncbi:activator of the mannose operon (transcriptional antiterminator) [Pantoea sp. PA1]|jgi:transcriptional antiterminator|uniref:BglG family transcription antiterminator n=1 Tax=Pantoea ananas TaxID=553 RepID=UPI0003B1C29E|nr:PRD domain-containing protein [Pantoea ananatis]ERM14928.1 LicR [Pantoea ananatis BRT175]MDC7865655.1 hypothetical protein [Pantoea ananatis]PVY82625.1 transcriptional antiterminator [Pantoea ananatis]CRH39932.1 LicR {ECO:0000313/EMBL:ERM14928.1} [Pantoea ananatis]
MTEHLDHLAKPGVNVLTQRQKALIHLLASQGEWRSATDIARTLKVSASTLRRDVDSVNHYFADKESRILSKPGLGLLLENGVALPVDLHGEEVKGLLKNKRLVAITTDLLTCSPSPLTLSALAEKYFISRSSIVADLRKIEVWLAPFSLRIARSHSGTCITGSDRDIRLALKEIITFSVMSGYPVADSRIDRFSRVQLVAEFGSDNVACCINLITYIEEALHCAISEPYYTNLFSHLLVTIKRALNGTPPAPAESDMAGYNNHEWSVARQAVRWLEENYAVSFAPVEVHYIYQYLISSGRHPFSAGFPSPSHYDEDAVNYATTLITRLSSLLRQNIGSDSVLLNALVSHVKPMLNRLAYRIVIHNPLLDEIRKEFAAVFNVVKQAVLHLNQQWGLPTASDDEIAYLTIYIQNALEKCHATKRVMLVCSSGIGTSQLLSSRISRAFPEWEIVDIVPGARLNEAIKKVRCDLIISTIRLEETEHPVAYVSALFSNRDVLRVMECLNKEDNANGVTDA